MKRRISLIAIVLGLLLSSIGLFLILNLTNPLSSGPFGILIVLGLIYLIVLTTLLILQRFLEVVYHLTRPNKKNIANEHRARMLRRRTNLIIIAISLIPIFVVSMISIGQLNVIDVILIIVVEAILIFYIVRRTAIK